MKRILFFALFLVLAVMACRPAPKENNTAVDLHGLPTAVPVVIGGTPAAAQPGPLWVLISGVDEHGLLIDHSLNLLAEPNPTAERGVLLHSGIAAAVLEIHHTGPQNLQRFYKVQTITGQTGWISDYYVRRTAYLFDDDSDTISIYSSPNGIEIAELTNVSPVTVKNPLDPDWWLIQSVEHGTFGWVQFEFIRESPVWEFLLNQQHDH